MHYKDSTKETYNTIAPLYIEDFSDFVPLEDFLLRSIKLLKERKLLNNYAVCLGAGPGNDADLLLKNGVSKIICLDFAENFTNFMKERFKEDRDIKVICEDISVYLPKLGNSSISLYVDSFTLMHFPNEDMEQIISEISRTLVKHGLFVMICFEGIFKGMEQEFYQTDKDKRLNTSKKLESYMNYFSIEELIPITKRYGLEVIRKDILEPTGRVGDPENPRMRMIFEKI